MLKDFFYLHAVEIQKIFHNFLITETYITLQEGHAALYFKVENNNDNNFIKNVHSELKKLAEKNQMQFDATLIKLPKNQLPPQQFTVVFADFLNQGLFPQIQMGNLATVKALHAAGVPLNLQDAGTKETAMHCAIKRIVNLYRELKIADKEEDKKIYQEEIEKIIEITKYLLGKSFALANFSQDEILCLKKHIAITREKERDIVDEQLLQLFKKIQAMDLIDYDWLKIEFEQDEVVFLKEYLIKKQENDLSTKLPPETKINLSLCNKEGRSALQFYHDLIAENKFSIGVSPDEIIKAVDQQLSKLQSSLLQGTLPPSSPVRDKTKKSEPLSFSKTGLFSMKAEPKNQKTPNLPNDDELKKEVATALSKAIENIAYKYGITAESLLAHLGKDSPALKKDMQSSSMQPLQQIFNATISQADYTSIDNNNFSSSDSNPTAATDKEKGLEDIVSSEISNISAKK